MLDADQVESRLANLESIGWRLGLERMWVLCERLGDPQFSYETVHVVGTNGKTSVARMLEGLLLASGVRAGSSVSPHLNLWRERISVNGRTVAADDFARAATHVFDVAAAVEAELGPDRGRLTQFEVATAIAFVALAEAGVEVAVIEAGMGGRLDASNVLESCLTVLTSIGIDHVDWLGATETEIAAEKLAVLRPGSTLLVGPVSPPVLALAHRYARERASELITVPGRHPDSAGTAGSGRDPGPAAESLRGPFRRLDLEIAVRAATFVLDRVGAQGRTLFPAQRRSLDLGSLDLERATAVVAGVEIPGRLEVWPGEPEVVFDVAHNPQGAVALAEALPEVAAGRPVIACIAVLADKDAAGIAAALAAPLDSVICTELSVEQLSGAGRPGASFHPASQLAASFEHLGIAAESIVEPAAALRRLREKALERKALALVTGSHFLVASARDRRLWQH